MSYIFDLDHTLVHRDNKGIHIRPYAKRILNYLYKNNFKVGIWSTGLDYYVKEVIQLLFKDRPLSIALARSDNYKNPRIIDLKTNKTYRFPVKDGMIVKKISFLLNHKDFKIHKNTILIDDLQDNICANLQNHIYPIYEWRKTMKQDKELLGLLHKIKKNYTIKKT